MWSVGARWLAVWCAIVAVAWPGRAAAFRAIGGTARFDGQATVTWHADSIELELSSNAAPLSDGAVASAANASINGWQAQAACSVPALNLRLATFPRAAAGDGRNSVEWIDSGWGRRGFDPAAPAQTDVQFQTNADGVWEIVEADIYLNAENFTWTESPTATSVTLEPVLLHELGHVLGLLHPCGDDAPGEPACSDDAAFDTVVMNPAYSAARGVLSQDDQAGVCELYPRPTDDCRSDDDCGPSLRCDERHNCVAGVAGLGEDCSVARDCASGACSENRCAAVCKETSDCSPAERCSVDEDGVGACVTVLSSMGESCQQSEECATRQCVLDQQGKGYCTHSCTTNEACPADWTCAAASTQRVCVPNPITPEGGSCSVSTRTSSNRLMAVLAFCAGICLFRRGSRKR